MARFGAIHLRTSNLEELASFYSTVLNMDPAMQNPEMVLFNVEGFWFMLGVHETVAGNNTAPERTFFDLMVDDVDTETERAVAAGATVIVAPYDFEEDTVKIRIATLADPDGNYFQLSAPAGM